MATEEMVTEQFQFLGIELPKEVLTKCVSICEEYDVDAETFIEQWMAFSLTYLNGAPPSLQNFELLAKREFSKRAARPNALPNEKLLSANTGPSLTIYGKNDSNQNQSDNGVLSNYITTSPKIIKMEPLEQVPNKLSNELCPATYSPSVDNTGTFSSRTNQGAVVHSYGDENLLDRIAQPDAENSALELNIKQVPNADGDIYTKAMFGFELLHEKANIIDNHISYLSRCIMHKLGCTELSSVRHKTQSEVLVAGRVECDADARLNPKSVVLQGTWEESLSQSVPVDLDSLKQYSLFPGQVVVMRGVNPRGVRFVAREVYSDAARPPPDPSADATSLLTGTVSLVVAAGPYTTSNNLAYAPLKELITYVSSHKPQVLILTGPFLDSDHAKVKDNSMAETFKSFFDKLIDSVAEINISSPSTKIYIVSSSKDAFHVNIYPTPPYPGRRKHPNVHFLPDPATLDVNGVIIGVTSVDVLMQISQEEISHGMGGDKLSRLAGHVLQQAGYWARAGAGVDAALWAAHAQLPLTPHLLLLPSNFRYFVKDVNGCVVVNPEHLTKGAGGGTFARLLLARRDHDVEVAAQIVRI